MASKRSGATAGPGGNGAAAADRTAAAGQQAGTNGGGGGGGGGVGIVWAKGTLTGNKISARAEPALMRCALP